MLPHEKINRALELVICAAYNLKPGTKMTQKLLKDLEKREDQPGGVYIHKIDFSGHDLKGLRIEPKEGRGPWGDCMNYTFICGGSSTGGPIYLLPRVLSGRLKPYKPKNVTPKSCKPLHLGGLQP